MHDAWTPLNCQSVVLGHFISFPKTKRSDPFCLETKELPEKHTAENLAQSIKKCPHALEV